MVGAGAGAHALLHQVQRDVVRVASGDQREGVVPVSVAIVDVGPRIDKRFKNVDTGLSGDATEERSVERAVSGVHFRAVIEQSYHEMDQVMMLPVRYGVGFMLGSETLSFYGPDTPRASSPIPVTIPMPSVGWVPAWGARGSPPFMR